MVVLLRMGEETTFFSKLIRGLLVVHTIRIT